MYSETSIQELANFMHNVAWLRKQHGLSRKKMAILLGIGVGTLSKIENGELPPRLGIEIFFTIQRQFGISPYNMLSQRILSSLQ